MIDDNVRLIPELANWNNGSGITLKAWISGVGRFDHAVGYASIFWPTFTEYEGCIFRIDPDITAYHEGVVKGS